MKPTTSYSRKNKITATIVVLLIITFFIPTPYYLFQPGSVEELSSKVSVEHRDEASKGELHLTTVLSLRASNIFYLTYGLIAPHTEIRKVKEVRGDMSDEEYDRLNQHMMESSQQHAIVAGLRAAHVPVNIRPDGVFVKMITPTSKANGIMKVGDIITEVDGKKVYQADDFLEHLKGKREGDKVTIVYQHEREEFKETFELIPLTNSINQAGLGIVPEDQFEIETPEKIKINAEDIGGPSAGLMFSLEIYDQLTKGDLTKGYEIAGTGTIDMNGNVGQIGGIREKIVAVHKAGMDIFFCPADLLPGDSNEQDVKEMVASEGYDVKVVPVQTLQEAIAYLNGLPPKS